LDFNNNFKNTIIITFNKNNKFMELTLWRKRNMNKYKEFCNRIMKFSDEEQSRYLLYNHNKYLQMNID